MSSKWANHYHGTVKKYYKWRDKVADLCNMRIKMLPLGLGRLGFESWLYYM